MKSTHAVHPPMGPEFQQPISNPELQIVRPRPQWVTIAVGSLGLFMALCGLARAGNGQPTVMLVRQWNPDTGVLIGWLPSHDIVISLESAQDKKAAKFDLNEAVNITWVKRNASSQDSTSDLRISPDAREFDGQKWLPLSRDANMVWIKKSLFLIHQIVLEGSPYRRPTKLQAEACPDEPGAAKSFTSSCTHKHGR